MSEGGVEMPGWLKGLLIGCGVIVAVGLLGMAGCIYYFGSQPESGVKLANEMDDYALEYIEEHGLLESGEELRAYYDATMSMNGSEAAILTDRRVMSHRGGDTTAIELVEIVEVDHREEALVGDIIEVVDRNGNALRIEIAMFNDGPAFVRALERARVAVEAPAEVGAAEPAAAEAAEPATAP